VAWVRTSGGEPVAGMPGIGGFRQSAEVDRETYVENQPVVLTYRVCRSRPWPTTTDPSWVGPSSLTAEFRVVDDQGDVVADTTHRVHVLLTPRPTRWRPGQCRWVGFEWDQRFWNQPHFEEPDVAGTPVRGDRVGSGSYRFEVWWAASRGGEPREQTSEPIETAPFLIEP
jgi:hypothetical protein